MCHRSMKFKVYTIHIMYIECLYAVYALLVKRATRVQIWNAATGKLQSALKGYITGIYSVAYNG